MDETKNESSPIELKKNIFKEILKIYKSSALTDIPISSGNQKKDSSKSINNTFSFSKDILSLTVIGQIVQQPVYPPSSKGTIIVLGNISAGKSSFINWVVKEYIQKTGMAIETLGLTIVTSGKSVSEISGESTLLLRPNLRNIAKNNPGFLENLSLKTCPSRNGYLEFIDLIDSPGLADGELQYLFDVEKVIYDLRHHIDLFLIFLDPIGQALSRRLLSVAKSLDEACPEKVRFCLSKIDQIPTEEERIKVMCQTTQSLIGKISSRHGFDLIPIYIPGIAAGTYLNCEKSNYNESKTVNRINEILSEIERVGERRVQDAMNQFNADVVMLTHKVDKLIEKIRENQIENSKYRMYIRRNNLLKAITAIIIIAFSFLHITSYIQFLFNHPIFDDIKNFNQFDRIVSRLNNYPLNFRWAFTILFTIVIFKFVCISCSQKSCKLNQNHTEDYSKLLECREFLKLAKIKWKKLNSIYLNHSTNMNSCDYSIIND